MLFYVILLTVADLRPMPYDPICLYALCCVTAMPAGQVSFAARVLWSSTSNVQVVHGEKLILECAADGWPVPAIRWSRYGGYLPRGRHSQSSGKD